MSNKVDLSIVIATYNRCHSLKGAIESALAQEAPESTFEVIVVDNNSTDGTSDLVHSMIGSASGRLHYEFEPRQGVSYARNRGIAASTAPIIAFMDDDVRPAPNWIATIKRVFDDHRGIDLVGGKVLPVWQCQPPSWLTRDHWMPLALLDYGNHPIHLDSSSRIGLISANCAIRKNVLVKAGGFRPELQRVRDNIGSMEDHELFDRLFRAGAQGLYWPAMQVSTLTGPDRLTMSYHRKWHFNHGYFFALFRASELEKTRTGYLFQVPAHLFRQMGVDAILWLKFSASLQPDKAFACENRLRFFAGFFWQRFREWCRSQGAASLSSNRRPSAP